jgi:hypothetical protein
MAESISEGTLRSWAKQVGDIVEIDDEVATIETDKVRIIFIFFFSRRQHHRQSFRPASAFSFLRLRGLVPQLDTGVSTRELG